MKAFYFLSVVSCASAVCFCPLKCVGQKCGGHDVATCNDIESRDECLAANAEVTDMVNSMGKNADLFLLVAADDNLLTQLQASRLRTHLSFAFEDATVKPVGDCEGGLSTDTRIKGTRSHCFSPSLLGECAEIKSKIGTYATSIHTRLRASIMSGIDSSSIGLLDSTNTPVSIVQEFISSVQKRGSLNTAVIRCASYEETIGEIEASALAAPSVIALLLCLLLVV